MGTVPLGHNNSLSPHGRDVTSSPQGGPAGMSTGASLHTETGALAHGEMGSDQSSQSGQGRHSQHHEERKTGSGVAHPETRRSQQESKAQRRGSCSPSSPGGPAAARGRGDRGALHSTLRDAHVTRSCQRHGPPEAAVGLI